MSLSVAGSRRAIIGTVAVGMSTFHLYTAIFGVWDSLLQRATSFLFAGVLIFLTRPTAPRRWLPPRLATVADGLLPLLLALSVGWVLWEHERVVSRWAYVDPMRTGDILFGALLIVLVLEATRRTVNLALPLIAITFLLYTYFGPNMPGDLAHKGMSLLDIIDHQYLTDDGIWTLPLGVFSTYIFLFILLGAFLEISGAGQFYIDLAFALTGRMRGGPAKAAVVSSAMMGTITGSANANVVTTGTFTIPMMKKMGYAPHVAGAVETAASTGGQVMPPIMGISAFLISEFTGVPYFTIVKISVIPALIYFLSVFLFVHFEACKLGIAGLPREQLPVLWATVREGWHFFIPPVLIVYVLYEGYTVFYAGMSAITVIVVLAVITGGLEVIRAVRSGQPAPAALARALWRGVRGLFGALEKGALNSLIVAGSCATVGLVIGALVQTGLGLKFSSLVISGSQGSLFLGLFLVAFSSFILGMGLPTSAAYIVLSVMAAPALIELGGMSMLTAHIIVFWFSLDSCFTPPVCVPAYTAAGLAQADPVKTGWHALRIAKGMYIIPFMFAYTPLLLNGPPLDVLRTIAAVTLGMVALTACIEGYLFRSTHLAERLGLGVAATAFFWPIAGVQLVGLAFLTGVAVSQGGMAWGSVILGRILGKESR